MPKPVARRRSTRPTIRRLSSAAMLTFGILVVFIVVSLGWTTTLLRHSLDAVIRDAESRTIASEVQLALLTHQRLSNLHVLTGEATLRTTASELAVEMQDLLARADALSGSEGEHELLDEVERRLSVYLQERDRLDQSGIELAELVSLTQPALNDTVRALDVLHDLNDAQVREADARALRVTDRAIVVASIAGAVLVLGLVAMAFGVRHYILRPLLALHQVIRRLEAGTVGARADGGGLSELAELARGINEMTETLGQQREAQLTFLAGVAHDLRNPLNAIKLGFYALELEQSDARRHRARERLERQVDRLARMVDDLLDATRIEAGNLEIRLEPLDLRDVAEDMVRLYAPTSPEHQITAHLPDERVEIQGDPLRLEQVVSNLLSNAIKFSPGGGPVRIDVTMEGSDVVLSVSDRGVGIPREELPSMFLPFRRRRPDIAPGAGLGLSVVRHIVAAHGGSIDVQSDPGAGTTFRVRLPRADQAAEG